MSKRPATMRPKAARSAQRRHLAMPPAGASLPREPRRRPKLPVTSSTNPSKAKICPNFAVAKFPPVAALTRLFG
jgi:hypothetical protein